MTNKEKREAVYGALVSRIKKNQYTQDSRRSQVANGFGDCSSTTRWAYQSVLGIDIGVNTEAQIKSKLGKIVDLEIVDGIPDESKMLLGDLLYYRGKNDSRYLGVGHVEMYAGNGNIIGHPPSANPGPQIRNMKSYCTAMQKAKTDTRWGNRGLIRVVRFIEDDDNETIDGMTEYEFIEWVKDLQKAINVKVDGVPGPKTLAATPTLKTGSRGEVVRLVQLFLVCNGCNVGKIDGIFGKGTKNAVMKYQKEVVKLKYPDGIITSTKSTWKSILRL